jgi:TolB-like protein/tetratricopeptide (TPR) repeat protein
VVTRDALRRRLWGDETVVDVEVGLNSAVSRLRRALGDSVGTPRMIETLPKRGYRFLVPLPRRPGIAVMPFANDSPDAETDYFSDGLTEELIRSLARVEGLRVMGRSVVFQYKGQARYDVTQLGKDLGVEAVLEGSVRKSGDRIRITVHLVSVEDRVDLWAHRFDTQLTDVFAVQDDVCERITQALKVRYTPHIPEGRPRNVEAYTRYLKGHHLTKRQTPADLQRGYAYFQEAIRLDPSYALPYHGAALYYILRATFGSLPARDALPEADALLSKGLEMDQHSAMLHMTMGMLRMFQWRWREAEQHYRQAIALEPANAYPHMMCASLYFHLGRFEEALGEAKTALELDPLDPMTNTRFVECLHFSRQYAEAIRHGRAAIELMPEFHLTYWPVVWSLAALGRWTEAWTLASKARSLSAGQPLCDGFFGYIAGASGHVARARAVLNDLKAGRRQGCSPALAIALTYHGLGDANACLSWLETAFEERDPFLMELTVWPGYDSLRRSARFRGLTRKLQLPG